MISTATGDADRPYLAARFVTGPQLSEPAEAERRLADWFVDISPEHARVLEEIIGQFPHAKSILAGIAEASPYLFDLLKFDAARTLRLLQCDPDNHIAALIGNAVAEVACCGN